MPSELIADKERMDFRFRVERVENLGSYSLVYGKVGSQAVIANLSRRHPVLEGTERDFSVRMADVRYYDKSGGARVMP